MAHINKQQKVVCVCRYGQVRSVCARFILTRIYSFRKVIACGWENTDVETLAMLFKWADVVMVVGRPSDWNLPTPPEKTVHLEVGADEWGDYRHPKLIGRVLGHLIQLVT